MKDKSKLTAKKIRDKNGKATTVWVRGTNGNDVSLKGRFIIHPEHGGGYVRSYNYKDAWVSFGKYSGLDKRKEVALKDIEKVLDKDGSEVGYLKKQPRSKAETPYHLTAEGIKETEKRLEAKKKVKGYSEMNNWGGMAVAVDGSRGLLNKNHYGNVVKVANQGFSINRTEKKLIKFFKEKGLEYDTETARTGTTYMNVYGTKELETNYKIRIANHTKRNEDPRFTDVIVFGNNGKSGWALDEVNIMNKDSLDYFLGYLNYKYEKKES